MRALIRSMPTIKPRNLMTQLRVARTFASPHIGALSLIPEELNSDASKQKIGKQDWQATYDYLQETGVISGSEKNKPSWEETYDFLIKTGVLATPKKKKDSTIAERLKTLGLIPSKKKQKKKPQIEQTSPSDDDLKNGILMLIRGGALSPIKADDTDKAQETGSIIFEHDGQFYEFDSQRIDEFYQELIDKLEKVLKKEKKKNSEKATQIADAMEQVKSVFAASPSKPQNQEDNDTIKNGAGKLKKAADAVASGLAAGYTYYFLSNLGVFKSILSSLLTANPESKEIIEIDQNEALANRGPMKAALRLGKNGQCKSGLTIIHGQKGSGKTRQASLLTNTRPGTSMLMDGSTPLKAVRDLVKFAQKLNIDSSAFKKLKKVTSEEDLSHHHSNIRKLMEDIATQCSLRARADGTLLPANLVVSNLSRKTVKFFQEINGNNSTGIPLQKELESAFSLVGNLLETMLRPVDKADHPAIIVTVKDEEKDLATELKKHYKSITGKEVTDIDRNTGYTVKDFEDITQIDCSEYRNLWEKVNDTSRTPCIKINAISRILNADTWNSRSGWQIKSFFVQFAIKIYLEEIGKKASKENATETAAKKCIEKINILDDGLIKLNQKEKSEFLFQFILEGINDPLATEVLLTLANWDSHEPRTEENVFEKLQEAFILLEDIEGKFHSAFTNALTTLRQFGLLRIRSEIVEKEGVEEEINICDGMLLDEQAKSLTTSPFRKTQRTKALAQITGEQPSTLGGVSSMFPTLFNSKKKPDAPTLR